MSPGLLGRRGSGRHCCGCQPVAPLQRPIHKPRTQLLQCEGRVALGFAGGRCGQLGRLRGPSCCTSPRATAAATTSAPRLPRGDPASCMTHVHIVPGSTWQWPSLACDGWWWNQRYRTRSLCCKRAWLSPRPWRRGSGSRHSSGCCPLRDALTTLALVGGGVKGLQSHPASTATAAPRASTAATAPGTPTATRVL